MSASDKYFSKSNNDSNKSTSSSSRGGGKFVHTANIPSNSNQSKPGNARSQVSDIRNNNYRNNNRGLIAQFDDRLIQKPIDQFDHHHHRRRFLLSALQEEETGDVIQLLASEKGLA